MSTEGHAPAAGPLPRWRRVLVFLAVVGPGLITASVDNDAGGITTYSVAGAQFGPRLLWTLIPITVALVVVQEMSARMGVVTGKGLADLNRENFGVRITFWISLALIVANLANTIAEFAGVAPDCRSSGCRPGSRSRSPPRRCGCWSSRARTARWRRASWWPACSTSPTPSRRRWRSPTGRPTAWRW